LKKNCFKENTLIHIF